MLKAASGILAALWLSLTLCPVTAWAEPAEGQPWRVAIVQGGSYLDYQKQVLATLTALSKEGCVPSLPDALEEGMMFNHPQTYSLLAHATQGGRVTLLPDGLYTGQWDEARFKSEVARLEERVRTVGDVDMIWALGTVAGKAMASHDLKVPVLVMGATGAAEADWAGKGEYPERPYFHVLKERGRYAEELSLYHSLFHFKRLGVILDTDPVDQEGQGRSVIENKARDLGFEMVLCEGPVQDGNLQVARKAYSRCVKELSTKVDAVYLTGCNGADHAHFYHQIAPLILNKIPVFSQSGPVEVERGALMAFAAYDFNNAGEFEAQVIRDLIDGKPLEGISQDFYAPIELVLNLETARLIGWLPDFKFLVALDKTYRTIVQGVGDERSR